MLDLNLIKENTQYVVDALKKKGWEVDFTETLNLMEKRKELILKTESLKAEKNKLSASVPQVKKAGGEAVYSDGTDIFPLDLNKLNFCNNKLMLPFNIAGASCIKEALKC